LGLRPDKTIYDLARSSGSLDSEKLDAYLMKHASGARILLAPTRPDQASVVTVDFLRDVFTTLRTMSDYVIVDTPPGFTPEVIAAIDTSSHVCMVGMLDALSLKNTKLGLETLELMAYNPERIALVLNRADTRVGITGEDVEAIIRKTGFFHSKARAIIEMSQDLVRVHGGEVPSRMEDLVKLRGVGRKTANVVLGVAFGVPGFAVDTHVTRLTRLLRLTSATDPVKIEEDVCSIVPPAEWTNLSLRLILHGRRICIARRPRCGRSAEPKRRTGACFTGPSASGPGTRSKTPSRPAASGRC